MKGIINYLLTAGWKLLIDLLMLAFICIPLQYLNFPWWADAIIAIIVCLTNIPGAILSTVVWVWSFINFVRTPFDTFGIIYLVCLVLYLAMTVFIRIFYSRCGKEAGPEYNDQEEQP